MRWYWWKNYGKPVDKYHFIHVYPVIYKGFIMLLYIQTGGCLGLSAIKCLPPGFSTCQAMVETLLGASWAASHEDLNRRLATVISWEFLHVALHTQAECYFDIWIYLIWCFLKYCHEFRYEMELRGSVCFIQQLAYRQIKEVLSSQYSYGEEIFTTS